MSLLVITGLLWLAYIIFLDQRKFRKFVKEAREQEYIDKVLRDSDKQQEYIKPVEPPKTPKLKYDRYRYLQYIQSPEWRKKSLLVKQKANFRCKSCNSSTNLQTHHITYKNLYNEKEDQLVCLCANCHQDLHNYYGKNASYYPLLKIYQP